MTSQRSARRDAATMSRVIAIIPVGALPDGKSRLGEVLDAEERHDLVLRLARRTIRATLGTPAIAETLVVTPDDEVREVAARLGARPIRQRTTGLNQGLREARGEALAVGAAAILVLPIDLPTITAAALDELLARLAANAPSGPVVALIPDRHRRGTNVLYVRPPDAIDFCFGGDSRAAHVAGAAAAGITALELDSPLALDLDTPDDLLRAGLADPRLSVD